MMTNQSLLYSFEIQLVIYVMITTNSTRLNYKQVDKIRLYKNYTHEKKDIKEWLRITCELLLFSIQGGPEKNGMAYFPQLCGCNNWYQCLE